MFGFVLVWFGLVCFVLFCFVLFCFALFCFVLGEQKKGGKTSCKDLRPSSDFLYKKSNPSLRKKMKNQSGKVEKGKENEKKMKRK